MQEPCLSTTLCREQIGGHLGSDRRKRRTAAEGLLCSFEHPALIAFRLMYEDQQSRPKAGPRKLSSHSSSIKRPFGGQGIPVEPQEAQCRYKAGSINRPRARQS